MEIHGLSMLNCLITIGDEDPNDTLHILNKITVNEVVNLQIKDSYQTLINTATVEFTRQITIKSSLKDEFGTREVKLVGDKDSLFKRGKRINIKTLLRDRRKPQNDVRWIYHFYHFWEPIHS